MSGGIIALLITLTVIGGITASTVSYFTLQRHRADAVALAGYRRLAELSLGQQESLHAQLEQLTTRLGAVEELLRSVE
jgi:type II secretory pathway pseudopilin PulG